MMLYYILLPFAWLLWHLGFRIRVEGRENLKKVQTKGYILAPTHVSAIDPVFIAVTRWGGRMVIFAKKELFEINAFLSWFFRCCGGVCVRGTKDEVAVIAQTVEACKNGRTLLIFPEGTREKEGKLLPPKSGLFVIAAGAGVDVMPCRILYDTPDGKMHLFCKVRVIYGEPMPAAQFAMEGRRDTKKSCVPTSRPCWMRGRRWDGEENVMEIKVAKTAGFCFGVNRAVELTYGLLAEGRRVATLGPLIHNPQAVADMQAKGAFVADSVPQVPDGYEVVIRSHGVPRSVYDELEARGIAYHDATCPFVQKIQRIAAQAEKEGAVLLVAGDKTHPEVQGIVGHTRGEVFVFADLDELAAWKRPR